eukprot:SM000265S09795  [mRNA]  locus=s265:16049:16996:- [translate_table: standard]
MCGQVQRQAHWTNGALRARAARLQRLARQEAPRTLHELTLYGHASKLAWDPDAPGRVAGRVLAGGDVRPFEVATAGLSAFDVTNAIWDILDEQPPLEPARASQPAA